MKKYEADKKICNKCLKVKPLNNFYKNKKSKGGRLGICSDCRKEWSKNYSQKHLWRKIHPWKQSLSSAKQRCNNKNHNRYKYYGGRGIKVLLTNEEIEFIWHRDKAHLLKDPTIDRIDNNGNYDIGNCRFIERSENTSNAQINVRLTENDRIKIRTERLSGKTYKSLSNQFGIAIETIKRIIKRGVDNGKA